MRRLLIIAAGLAFAWGVAGCGEKPTVTVYKQGHYQGKPDTRPWDNAPPAGASAWQKGDQGSWEKQIKKRNEGQNEYARLTPSAN